jgi:hypothetical protein
LPVYECYVKIISLLVGLSLHLETYMTTITLTLPEWAMDQVQQAAATLKRPVEEVLRDLLVAVLPPLHDAPADMQEELTCMTWLDSPNLWRIARGQLPAEAQEQMQQLSQLQGTRSLTPKEQTQLDMLRQEYGRMTLRKARAHALLSLRGGEPLLSRV